MKKLSIAIALISSLTLACNNSPKNQTNEVIEETPSIGGNKDKNGCLTSAGQTWSKIKNDCIQVFSEGIRLNPTQIDSTEAIISAFVVPNADSSAYELFLADQDETVILNKKNDDTFAEAVYIYNKKTGELFVDQKVAYKAE